MGFGSREIADRAAANPVLFSALTAISGGRLVPAPGGVLIVSDGEIVGAVGIFARVAGYTLSLTRLVLTGQMDAVIKTIERNTGLI